MTINRRRALFLLVGFIAVFLVMRKLFASSSEEDLCRAHGGVLGGVYDGIGNPFVSCWDGSCFDLMTRRPC